MKTLIYDNECPLCVAYTGAFVKTGLLEKEGRKNFSEIDNNILCNVDTARMHNEIPLIETETGKVWYGIDALLEVLGTKLPFIKTIGKLAAVNWLLKKLYKLVSYNRKVIVAVPAKGYDCSPDFNTRYRVLFLLIGLIFNSWFFTLNIPLFIRNVFPAADAVTMQAAHFTLVAINICMAIVLGKQRGLEYLGQVNMLALLTMLLILPFKCLSGLLSQQVVLLYLGAVFFFIAGEYIRRMKYASIFRTGKFVVLVNIICLCILLMILN